MWNNIAKIERGRERERAIIRLRNSKVTLVFQSVRMLWFQRCWACLRAKKLLNIKRTTVSWCVHWGKEIPIQQTFSNIFNAFVYYNIEKDNLKTIQYFLFYNSIVFYFLSTVKSVHLPFLRPSSPVEKFRLFYYISIRIYICIVLYLICFNTKITWWN